MTKPPITPIEMLTADEAAAYLMRQFAIRRSTATLRNYRYHGGGPVYIKVGGGRGGRIRYRPVDLDKWATKGMTFHTTTHDPGVPVRPEDLGS